MDPLGPDLLIRSFERQLDAENRSSRTVIGYLVAVRRADSFLRERGASLEAATRGDLEAFLGDLLSRRKASTAAHLPQGPQDPLRLAALSAGSAR